MPLKAKRLLTLVLRNPYETGLANRQQPVSTRLMFPIHDRSGKPIAFGGRALSHQANPKYLNSKETEWFHKQKTLYGFFQADNP